MGTAINSILYNLAFSPKIKFIDISNNSATAETVESLFKLLNISGSIETLIMNKNDVNNKLNVEFWKAIGENKTLQHLDISINSGNPGDVSLAGKGLAMNARKNGSLRSVSMMDWLTNTSRQNQFLESLRITEQEHEMWYGDQTVAKKMTKDDAYKKVMHFNLKYLNIGGQRVNLSS